MPSFDFTPMDRRHHDERQAAEAPAFLRRDSDRTAPGPQKADVVREIPFSRATGDLVHQLDEQEQLLLRLYERLDSVLEIVPCDPEQAGVDVCGYTNSPLVVGLAHHAARVRLANRQLVDIITRLAI